ncbi:MAG: hypothetical protein RIQ70_638 [Bacteroidota bacterium]|jgi:hypothetical protein
MITKKIVVKNINYPSQYYLITKNAVAFLIIICLARSGYQTRDFRIKKIMLHYISRLFYSSDKGDRETDTSSELIINEFYISQNRMQNQVTIQIITRIFTT